ncbi:hypothetical protein [Streptomyces chartreusis]|uniref:hypothetical protein n=1 Tax=Streptomyces chartreusis TaxID=1969 RepID=UPI00362CA0FE
MFIALPSVLAHARHVLADVVDVVPYVVDAGVQGGRDAVQRLAGGRPLCRHGAGSAALEGEECGDSRDHGRAND